MLMSMRMVMIIRMLISMIVTLDPGFTFAASTNGTH